MSISTFLDTHESFQEAQACSHWASLIKSKLNLNVKEFLYVCVCVYLCVCVC